LTQSEEPSSIGLSTTHDEIAPLNLSVSVVSHGQAALVSQLLEDLAAIGSSDFEVILTINVPEPLELRVENYPFPLRIVRNTHRKGFGANHNAAFAIAQGRFFAVLNPDIRIRIDPFPALCAAAAEPGVGVAAPLVLSPRGDIEDNARRFPTLVSLARKLMLGSHGPDYPIASARVSPDWVAGMFMVFVREAFASVSGFDERYFLYYEDVDLCWRLRRSGHDVRLLPPVRVVHEARRASHRDVGHMRLHLRSMLRFLLTTRFGLMRP
jgi:N-acetylglucosaminyl-diphospho-decaprenol L-rhamnosyltransferase